MESARYHASAKRGVIGGTPARREPIDKGDDKATLKSVGRKYRRIMGASGSRRCASGIGGMLAFGCGDSCGCGSARKRYAVGLQRVLLSDWRRLENLGLFSRPYRFGALERSRNGGARCTFFV